MWWALLRRVLIRLAVALHLAAIAVAGFFTLLRLITPDGRGAVLLTSFAFLSVPAVVVAIVLLPLVTVSAKGYVLPATAAIVLLPLASLQLVAYAPDFVGASTRPVEGDIVVMSFNTYEGGAGPAQIVAAVRDRNVDVLTLLEVTPWLLDQLDALGLAEILPNRVGHAEPGVWGTLTASRLPIEAGEELEPLAGHMVQLDTARGPIVYVGAHARAPDGDVQHWSRDHAEIYDVVSGAGDNVVLAGDLNATPDHEPMKRLADAGLTDSVNAVGGGWKPTWPANGVRKLGPFALPSLIQIDHIAGGPGIAFRDSTTVDIDGSDHRAVVATLGLR